MPIRASILPQATPGHAILRVTDLEAPPEGLTLSIERQQGPDSHLGEDGWRRTEAWLQPDQVVRIRGVLDFHLGPQICDRLAGIATVRLRIREPDVGVIAATVVAWPAMLTSGAIDGKPAAEESPFQFRRPPPQLAEPPAPPFEPEPPPPEPPRPIPELRAAREPLPEPEPSNWMGWLIAAVVVIAAAGGAGYYAYRTYFEKGGNQEVAANNGAPASPTPVPAKTAEPPQKSIRDTVAEYLATKPTPEAMVAKGKDYAQAGELAAAFLVWRRAAEAGNVDAELEIAGYYDPLSPRQKTGFAPDGARAADWYERAALAGNAEAQRKLGLLLAMGAAGMPADPAKARSWLQQAAAQNDADAKKALEQLGK
ncbi:Sel1 repeat-containing protein [Enhydrobacter aerosaccus]|uniref:Sel1 repeat-containing protein n=1 Tax=Enhydrobacter aerosaccus TaxID=225324 RepID=A0A1T4RBE5_9HYPH|nr:tetratricopeptide repeat protein [Enhydrobacter aerosaccus]SKA13370.1 Sel1 repeat-containing protein [Enhydrobacter aerosaccus]